MGSTYHPKNSVRRTDRLDYIQSMLRQLCELAKSERADMTSYLIEMAYLEISDVIRGESPLNYADEIKEKKYKTTRAA